MSNGAKMTYWAGAHLSAHIAAIAPVGATPNIEDIFPPLTKPVSMRHYHGLADAWAPYTGGPQRGTGHLRSVSDTIRLWRTLNHVKKDPRVVRHKGGVRETIYGDQGHTPIVALVTIAGLGHRWPGDLSLPWRDDLFGPRSAAVDATKEIVQFFLSQTGDTP